MEMGREQFLATRGFDILYNQLITVESHRLLTFHPLRRVETRNRLDLEFEISDQFQYPFGTIGCLAGSVSRIGGNKLLFPI
jgi:hypothetical protein